MANSRAAFTTAPARNGIPQAVLKVCFALVVVNVTLLPAAYFFHCLIYGPDGRGIPTDFINVYTAGKLVLQGHPALAYDWDIQKQLEVELLKQDFRSYFAWHYPPPFLFVACLLAQFPYAVAFIGWISASMLPYVAVMRAIVGRPFGWMLAIGFPVVAANALVGQNGFLTAALIGGTLYFLPSRKVLSGICLGLLTYKPQYGFLFPIVLVAAAEWTVFAAAAATAVALALASWIAFGTSSWQAFFQWMPVFSQAFLVEGRATWWKLQSLYALVRYLGGPEQLAWIFQWVLTAAVAATLVALWRSQLRYSLKAAALAIGALLTTPYLFMYDMMVLAIPVGYLVRLGVAGGFRSCELPALGIAIGLFVIFILFNVPVGFAMSVIVGALILRRAGPWWRPAKAQTVVTAATAGA